ncbi:peptidoglycan DD-metalloendopeptidase family protein [Ferruginivarius sediminum]|uniref:M23ase beta-sheet core domain-containing protein n=1 Tax=Ferruginivarius sediminum TaxID=2661937 RepID=A0A369TEP9_9PROT|nr:M23 family metallopeptidase [Ferruginivarius sediminum]RDD63730.1 hypothetical protein DRB17_00690 [Ferruginivarius sediminum]
MESQTVSARSRVLAGRRIGSGMLQVADDQSQSFKQRVARRLFRERDILLRSDGRVHYLRLTPRLQKAMAGGLLVVLLGVATVSGGLVWQQERLSQRAVELAESRAAREALDERMRSARRQVGDLLAQIGGQLDGTEHLNDSGAALSQGLERIRAGLTTLAARNSALAARVARARADLRRADAHAEQLAASRARLENELSATRSELAGIVSRREELANRLADARADQEALRASRQAEANARLEAEERAQRLAESLEATRRDEVGLRGRLDSLQAQVAESKKARSGLMQERKELAQRVGRLERTLGKDLGGEGGGEADLAGRIARLEKALLAAESKGTLLAAERDRLQGKVGELQDRLASWRDRQSGVLEHFRARARDGLDPIEKTVAMTGIDVDMLIARVQAEGGARGGPFIPASDEIDGALGEEVRRLEAQIERLVALQAGLRSLPLTAPLDAFWISSHFGKRRDPYNGRWAMHEGLDLAAQAGSPVHAAAPGKVVYAGRKHGYGRVVEVDHGYGITTRYAHLKSIAVERGTRLEHRDKVGGVGNSGRSTGTHLHYEILVDGEPFDPMNFLEAGKHVFKG